MTTTDAPAPDMKPVLKVSPSGDRVHLGRLASWVSQEVDAKVDPSRLSFASLRRMDNDPVTYLGERAITALVRKPDLYHVVSPTGSKKLVAETEAWLWPLMTKRLLGIIARSFVYGAIPYVLDWSDGINLVVRDPIEGGGTRKRTLSDFRRYVEAREQYPSDVEIQVDKRGDMTSLVVLSTGQTFDPGRGRVVVWDRQFGEWTGQSARRRAWPSFAKGRIFELLQARYLERTVHTPLIIRAPGKDVRSDGSSTDVPVGDYIAEQIANLIGGGYMTLPNDMNKDGTKYDFDFTPLELPERSEVFERSLDRFDGRVLAAYLVPPAMSMLDEGTAGGAASRVLRDLFATFVEELLGSAARELTEVVALVHEQNHGPDEPPCEVQANQIPEKVQQQYLNVLAQVGEAGRLGERVDVDQLLDYLGVPRRPDSPQDGSTSPPGPGPVGRPRDPTGAREQRRQDAATDQGAQDTGAPRDGNGDPLP